MARNGSGSYSNPYPNFVSGTVISSTEVDANNSDIATALTQSIAVDGQTTVTANLPMNTKKFTGLAVGADSTDSLTLGQAQAEAMVWCGTAGGTADAITLSPTPAITAYAAGQRFVWKASGSVNTGATTVAISGLGAIALQDNGAALVAGNHAANKIFMGILDTASTVQVMQVQISGTDPLIVSSLTVSGTSLLTGVTTHGGNVVSDTDSTDDLGTTSVRWKELFVDAITATDQVTATGFTGTLDGVLGGGTPAAATVTTLNGVTAPTAQYTTAEETKLAGIETAADVTDSTNVLASLVGQEAVATGFTGTLDGVLGGGTPAAATVTSFTASAAVNANGTLILKGARGSGAAASSAKFDYSGGLRVDVPNSADYKFQSNGTTVLSLTPNTTPATYLDVISQATGGAVILRSQGETNTDLRFSSNGSGDIVFLHANTASEFARFDGATTRMLVGKTSTLTADFKMAIANSSDAYGQLFLGATNGIGYGIGRENVTTGDFVITSVSGDADSTPSYIFRLESGGNLGLGADPLCRLHVVPAGATASGAAPSSTADGLLVDGNGNEGITILGGTVNTTSIHFGDSGDADIGKLVYDNFTNSMQFTTNASEAMRINSSGSLLVGTTSFTSGAAGTDISPSTLVTSEAGTGALTRIGFYNGYGLVGQIYTHGGLTVYATSSDYRLKNTIAPMTGALAKVALLKPVTYKWNADDSDGQGFIAHELQEVIADGVYGEKDGVDAEGKPEYQGVDTSFLVATLTAAIQEQQALIEALTTRIAALEG